MRYSSILNSEILPLTEGAIKNTIINYSSSQKNEALDELATALNDEILNISKSCGIIDYFKCRMVLKRSISKTQEMDFSEIGDFVDTIVIALTDEKSKSTGLPSASQ